MKISALFRVSSDGYPFKSLSERLEELLKVYGSQRLLWGSDFPYATEHTSYAEAGKQDLSCLEPMGPKDL